MSDHPTTSHHALSRVRADKMTQGQCSCGWKSEWTVWADAIDVEFRKHYRQVEKERARIAGGLPSVKAQAKQFKANSEDPRFTAEERRLWEQLARELENRSAQTERDDTRGQEKLW